MIEQIQRATDPRTAAFRDVRDGDLLRARDMFVAEGRLVVKRVLQDPRFCVQSLLINEAALADLAREIDLASSATPIFVCDPEQMRAISGYDVHRGCLAMVERPPATSLDDLLSTASGTMLVLEGVGNADNVGGAFRNAAAFGAGSVVLSPTCCDPLYRKAIRTSMGAVLRVPFARAEPWPDALTRIRAAGWTLVALTPRERSETLAEFVAHARTSRVAIVAGTEGAGLTPAVESAADHRVRIPISAEIDSLNVAVAIGIALHAIRRQA